RAVAEQVARLLRVAEVDFGTVVRLEAVEAQAQRLLVELDTRHAELRCRIEQLIADAGRWRVRTADRDAADRAGLEVGRLSRNRWIVADQAREHADAVALDPARADQAHAREHERIDTDRRSCDGH